MKQQTLYKNDFHNFAIWESLLKELDLPVDAEKVAVTLYEEKEVEEKEDDGNKHITLLHHDISYFFRDTELDIDDCAQERIVYMINWGYREGDIKITDPENDETYYGWWSIV